MPERTAASPREVRAALLATGLGGLLFTIDLPLLRLSMADHWTMVAVRGAFLFAAISGAWLLARIRYAREAPFIAGKAGLCVAAVSTLGNICYIGAVVHTDAANVVFIIAMTPLIAAAMSRLVLREKVHGVTWGATAMAFLGVALIASAGLTSGNWLGDALALSSAGCSAAIFTIIRATGAQAATSLALGSLSSAVVAVLFFGVTPSGLLASGAFGMPAWIWLALNGLVAIPLGTVLLARGPRVLPSADVSMFFMLETVLTPVWIWLLFGEMPAGDVLTGGAVVIATLLLHSWWRLWVAVRPRPAASARAN